MFFVKSISCMNLNFLNENKSALLSSPWLQYAIFIVI